MSGMNDNKKALLVLMSVFYACVFPTILYATVWFVGGDLQATWIVIGLVQTFEHIRFKYKELYQGEVQ